MVCSVRSANDSKTRCEFCRLCSVRESACASRRDEDNCKQQRQARGDDSFHGGGRCARCYSRDFNRMRPRIGPRAGVGSCGRGTLSLQRGVAVVALQPASHKQER